MIDLELGPDRNRFIFDINSYDEKTAVLFSGGMDSTLLAYLFFSELKKYKLKTNIQLFVIDRHNQPIDKAKKIVNSLSTFLNTEIKVESLDFPNIDNNIRVKIGSLLLRSKFKNVVSGWIQYPSDTTIRPLKVFQPTETECYKFPFLNLQKYHIIDCYYKLGIEHLLPSTHSCGSNNNIPCGKCFNCRERIWGYQQLGMPVELGS